MMIEEMLFHPAMRDTPGGVGAGWLMLMGALRDELPWVYEVGMEMYRALCSEDPEQIEIAHKRFSTVLELGVHSSPMRHMIDDPESHRMLRHLPDMLEQYLRHLPKPKKQRSLPAKKSEPGATS